MYSIEAFTNNVTHSFLNYKGNICQKKKMLDGVEETLVDFYIPGITYIFKKNNI